MSNTSRTNADAEQQTLDLPQVAIVNYGSQFTKKIESGCRENGLRFMTHEPEQVMKYLQVARGTRIVFLSGGPASVNDKDAPGLPAGFLQFAKERGIIVVGICYGMQLLAKDLGGQVASVLKMGTYGKERVRFTEGSVIFDALPPVMDVWASHGDSVVRLPRGFREIAVQVGGGAILGMASSDGRIYGVQFHFEVEHTRDDGHIMRTLLEVAGCTPDWRPESIAKETRDYVLSQVGDKGRVIMGMSGGVDSTTLGRNISILGRRLRAIAIDGGQLREGELEEIKLHAKVAGVTLKVVDARERFLSALAGMIEGEELRRAFKRVYAEIFTEEAREFGAEFFGQGSLAPDMIESGATGAVTLKSHHNVGLVIPGVSQLHPFANLFKYEVRMLAEGLGLPASVYRRHPSPGPGQFLHLVGVPPTQENLATLNWGEKRVRDYLIAHDLYFNMDQLVVTYGEPKTVGIKGDARVLDYAFHIRCVRTEDFMTTSSVHLPPDDEDALTAMLTAHPRAVRCYFDHTTKPPATTVPK